MTVTFIRHGETESNRKRCFLGSTDEGLSEIGKSGIESKKNEGYYPEADELYVSPMLRCRQTADIIYPDIKQHVVEAFKEMDFGVFEGKNHEEVDGRRDYQTWIDSYCELPVPGGESKESFTKRTISAWDELLLRFEDKLWEEYRVALVIHGGTIKAVFSELFGGEYFDYDIKHGEKISIRYSQQKGCWEFGG